MKTQKPIGLIMAISTNGVIGDSQAYMGLPFGRLKKDLQSFQKKTTEEGGIVVMGRVTADILRRNNVFPLKGRINIVISENELWGADLTDSNDLAESQPFLLATDFFQAISIAQKQNGSMIWIIGGRDVYYQAIFSLRLEKVVLTSVKEAVSGDTDFSLNVLYELLFSNYHCEKKDFVSKDEHNNHAYVISTFVMNRLF